MGEELVAGPGKPLKQSATLRVKAVLENVPLATDWVTECMHAVRLDRRMLYQIQLAVDEACANVVHHAYDGVEPGDMEITCRVDGDTLTIRVRDWGRGFDPGAVERPDIDAPLEKRTMGGLGLFIVEQVMDSVRFTLDPKVGNDLTMAKRLRVAG